MTLAFKIFILQASEDHCKKCEGPQCCVTPQTPQQSPEPDTPSMPTTQSALGFDDATGHDVLAPLGALAWVWVGLSCQKAMFLL